ncbi:hypothetical protein VTO73DRAFT_6545 [Trametes versicolor]
MRHKRATQHGTKRQNQLVYNTGTWPSVARPYRRVSKMPHPMVAAPSASEGGRLIAEKLPLHNTTRDCGLHESILDKSVVCGRTVNAISSRYWLNMRNILVHLRVLREGINIV